MNNAGRKPRVTPADVFAEFQRRGDTAEPLTAPEIAETLNCSRKTISNKLTELEDAGKVTSKKVGGRARVWWIPLEDKSMTDTSEDDLTDDPLFDLPTFVGGEPTDISANVDEHLATTIADESTDTGAGRDPDV